MDHIEGYDPAKDSAVTLLAGSVAQRGRWGEPNVLVEGDRLLPEIARLTPLFQKRIWQLARKATQAVGEDVELVVAGAKIIRIDALHVPVYGPSDLDETRASRAHAERTARARRILEVAAQVQTASDAHRRKVDALRKAAVDAAHYLNVIFHEHHRFADKFTFNLPDALEVDDAVYEIGHARVREALNANPTDDTTEEGAA